MTNQLVDTLKRSNFFESDEEGYKREIVLGRLNEIVRSYVRQKALEQGIPEEEASEAGGKIYTFGSYRLGVHSKGADIDTLCVVPMHVSRHDFFTSFSERLKECPEVTELTQVPDAYVPIMRLVFDGIPIDLLFARLQLSSIPDNLNLLNHNLLKNLDEKSTLSVNGSRATDEILSLVPNIPAFHTALRCIKFWARCRGLYNNAMGYVGGVACAILVARICQLYPNAVASRIVSRFFAIYYSWKWPQPIMLKHIEDFQLNLRVWNPRTNPSDRNHRMPIITPAYPSMCSTHNVSNSTLRLALSEFERGIKITNEIETGLATWDDLFAPSDFFFKYRHFLQIVSVSSTPENAKVWHGFIESKIRLFVTKLEQVITLVAAPPYPECFEKVVKGAQPEAVLQHLQFTQAEKEPKHDQKEPTIGENANSENDNSSTKNEDGDPSAPLDTSVSPTDGLRDFYTSAFYIALEIQPPSEQGSGPRRLNLSLPVAEFQRLCLSWDKHSPDMALYIREIKKSCLPDDVFKGQPRPRAKRLKLNEKINTNTLRDENDDTNDSPDATDDANTKKRRQIDMDSK